MLFYHDGPLVAELKFDLPNTLAWMGLRNIAYLFRYFDDDFNIAQQQGCPNHFYNIRRRIGSDDLSDAD